MTVLVVGSVRGGPGVTGTALLLGGWLDDSVVAEVAVPTAADEVNPEAPVTGATCTVS